MKTTKFDYYKVIQQHYGHGWEDVSHYEANSLGEVKEMSGKFIETKTGLKLQISLLKHDLKEYRLTGYATRVIFRKELKQLQTV